MQPALPDGYGIEGFHRDNLPIIPPVFQLVPRQVKADKGYKPDSEAAAQIKIIARLFRESERIIVATDAGREGELIFRYLYEYIGCATPFDRLWISSLTDKAIREGLERIESGNKYDNLYYAAQARSEADWLVGINATQAITIAAGRGTYSLGRVQTLIIRGEPAQTAERLAGTKPLLCDLLPLSLEEIFMYELGGSGYDVKKLML